MSSPAPVQALLRAFLPHIVPFRGCASCPARPLPLNERTTDALSTDFPVDVIYTWVDGADPKLAAKRAAYLPPEEQLHDVSQGKALFRDSDELRYSLRSLELYAPWVRHIFIVTDGQTPAWLTTAHPKIRMVDHSEIIPHEYLPTFSSRVIEAFLHRIPDLAEHFIYFNDDVFLSAPCTPGDFFTPNGLPYIFTDWRRPRRLSYEKSATPHTRSHANTRRYLGEQGIASAPGFITAHGPFAQTRRNACDAYAFFEKAIREFAHDKFRSMRGMVFYCHMAPLWAYAMRRGVPCDLPYYYINTKRLDRNAYYAALLREQGGGSLPLFFCLNDSADARECSGWHEDFSAFLTRFYPQPSSFEKPVPGAGGVR